MIPRYRKLLVTTDFSPLGNAAIPHAYAILSKHGGTVILCHVTEVHGPPNPLYAHYSPWSALSGPERIELRQTLLRSLEALVPEQARQEGIVTTEVRVVETPLLVHEAICQEAVELDVDLIVMASHGHSGVARLLMGSVAEHVLRVADRPVLIVRSRG
ncbi:Universal stress protein family protein [Candidatus Methylomirabilis lanthanidiphila]|uniref:Universal stress protein family protein n=1 Tax=Candidatus Methylomirabilis lanthanidiphila TaxID=2211376 RepID=A0A564ZL44_9BACT|nr:universal stress protein [Candidatus Methylomirabilis lanthanidiphila]VUZ85816.1 Universal stress protein family protein [Candidatus Methylomirabilis lanthanidiphila]